MLTPRNTTDIRDLAVEQPTTCPSASAHFARLKETDLYDADSGWWHEGTEDGAPLTSLTRLTDQAYAIAAQAMFDPAGARVAYERLRASKFHISFYGADWPGSEWSNSLEKPESLISKRSLLLMEALLDPARARRHAPSVGRGLGSDSAPPRPGFSHEKKEDLMRCIVDGIIDPEEADRRYRFMRESDEWQEGGTWLMVNQLRQETLSEFDVGEALLLALLEAKRNPASAREILQLLHESRFYSERQELFAWNSVKATWRRRCQTSLQMLEVMVEATLDSNTDKEADRNAIPHLLDIN